ncbi:MAG: diacylglyceryl transferase [Flavobacteriaceae bacterium]
MEKLKERWGITSNIQIILILIVFAINGSFAAWVASPVTEFIGLDRDTTHGLIYWPLRILLIFPIYQLTLPIVGFVFGQFTFFWNFEKKFLSRIGFGFLFKNSK